MTLTEIEKAMQDIKLPNEPYVVVDEVKELTNYRATEKGGKFYIPIANYDENNTRDHYTTFEEVKEWISVYGVGSVKIGIFANEFNEND